MPVDGACQSFCLQQQSRIKIKTWSFLEVIKFRLLEFLPSLQMPTTQSREGVYLHSLPVVSAALWDKYEQHDWIKEVEVMEQIVDEKGRLHSKRLLTMQGKVPTIFSPFFGYSRPIYLLEQVMVDMDNNVMEVKTTNVNFLSILSSNSSSRYQPSPQNCQHTHYRITVQTIAFPSDSKREDQGSRFGSISKRLEEFVGRSLLGNIKAGEDTLNSWIETFKKECSHGTSKVWLCSKLCASKLSVTQR